MSQVSYGTITITDTNDIEKIYVEYCRSTSNQLSGGVVSNITVNWSVNTPAWVNGEYIWQRSVVKKSGIDTLTYGTPVCLTGAQGETGNQGPQGNTGAAGRSLTSTTTQYTTAAANATITENNMGSYTWVDSVPAYNSSSPAYWVRVTNVYSNPSSTQYVIYKDNGITDAVKTSHDANTTANSANTKADNAVNTANSANTTATNAYNIATGINQHFWTIATDYATGLPAGSYITDTAIDTFKSQKTGGNILTRSDGIWIRNGIKTLTSLTGTALTFYNPSTDTAQLVIGANGVLQSGNYVYTSGTYSDSGTKIDLINGSIYTPGFRTDGSNTYIRGEINALTGKIGNNSSNYWTIGNYYNYDQTASAALISHGTAFIQLDTSNTWRLSTDRIHTAWNGTDSSVALMFPKDGDTYWDWGMHSPHKTNNIWKDKFIYARKYTNTSDDDYTNRDNLSNDLDDDLGYWTYQFYVDRNGSIYARNFYLLNADGTPGSNIGGQDAVYLLKSGGTITGNLEVNGTLTKGSKNVAYLSATPTSGQILVADGTSGGIKTSGFTIAKSVPSTAIFTDENVKSVETNTTKLWLVGSDTSGTRTGTLKYDSGVYITTTAGTLHATTFEGNLSGTASRATADGDGNTIKTTYLKLSGGNVTGAVTFGSSVSVDELTAGDLVVNGAASFTNNAQFNTINGVAVGSSPKFTDTTYNFAGVTFNSGNSSIATHDANAATANGHYYYTSNGPTTSLGASTGDGALYVQSYSDSWVGQIAQDYRNGRLFIRGRNNGTWQSWLKVYDSGNLTSQAAASGGTNLSLVTTGEKYTWNSKTSNTGTVTSVAASGSGGISISGSPITTSGTITIGLDLSTAINGLSEGSSNATRNDYIVAQYAGGGTTTTSYHRRKLSNIFAALNSSDITTALGYTPYNSTNPNGYTTNTGTVTSVRVQATSPVTSSVNTAQSTTLNTTIALADAYGDTKNPYGTKTANYVLAGPGSGNAATPSFRALVAADIPSLAWSKITSGKPTTSNGYGITDAIIDIGSNDAGQLVLTFSNNTTDTRTVSITATSQSSVAKAEALNTNGTKVGDTNKPVYFGTDGKPAAISYTINKSVPSDAKFTDTWTAMTGATSSANGTVGYVNAVPPKDGYNTKFLRADGTWVVPGAASNATNDSDGNPINTTYIKKSIGTAAGDIIYWSASGTPTRLAKGSNGQVLKLANGVPTWGTDNNDNTNYYHTTGSWNGLTYTATANGGAGALAFTLPTASASASGIVNTSAQVLAGKKTIKYTTRIYPIVGVSNERSQWYKITFPYYNAETTSSAKWFMNSFDLHFGGGFNSNASGIAHVTFYWSRAASNGAWYAYQVAAKLDGILMNKIALYYRIAEPGVLYVNNSSNNYNGIWLDNLFVDDTAPALDWSTISIEQCSAITVADYIEMPTVRTYNNNNTNYIIGNHTLPMVNNTYNLGSSDYKWANIYATTFNGSLNGNANTASQITNLTSNDDASSTATWRKVWISYNNNSTGRPAVTDSLVYQTSTDTLKAPHFLAEHINGGQNEFRITYGSTVDMAMMVGTGNENHGLYDSKAGKWMIYADGSGNVSVNGNAATATSATSATKDSAGNTITSTYVKKAGDTMTGCLVVQTTSSYASYNEGIRINKGSQGYSTLLLGGTSDATSGTNAGAWWIGVNNTSYPRRLMIAHNGSGATGTYFYTNADSTVTPNLRLGSSGTITSGNMDAVNGGTVYTAISNLSGTYVSLTGNEGILGTKVFGNGTSYGSVTNKTTYTAKANINYDSTLEAIVFSFA